MYSRCPHCDQQQPVSVQQLREARGLLHCKACGQAFDALPALSEQAGGNAQDSLNQEALFAFSRPADGRPWRVGSLLMALLLVVQLVYFQGGQWLKRPDVYSMLAGLCQSMGCRLEPYRNPEDWALSHGELQAHLAQRYWLSAALTNQAELAQSPPDLTLTLTDFSGRPVAVRRIPARFYTSAESIAAQHSFQVRLPISAPGLDVGGFTLSPG